MKERRLNRVFRKDGRTLIVAMDHPGSMGPMPGLENPGRTIEKVLDGGADVIMTTFGVAQAFAAEIGRAALLLRLDGGTSKLGDRSTARMTRVFGIKDALRLGADAVVCMGFPGSRLEHETLPYLSALATECLEWQMPLMAEMLPRGFEGGTDSRTPEGIALAVRVGAENGADIIKTQYTGSVESFKKVVENCYVPVVVLGGNKMETDRDVLETVHGAIASGARGVAMGRNIWQHAAPAKMTAAITSIIHGNASVDEALRELA